MSEHKWTAAQENFLKASGGPILVAAAAGSGKTAAIVQRVTCRLCDTQSPLSPDRLLMTTFSNAAAEEMRTRIESSVMQRLLEDPENPQLILQSEELGRAQISTIHSFCLKIIRENFSKLGLFCDFQVADEAQARILARTALEKVLENAYRSQQPDFYALIELICGPRDDRKLSEVILKLYDTVVAMPFPNQVLSRWLCDFSDSTQSYKKWAGSLAQRALCVVDYAEALCRHGLEVFSEEIPEFIRQDLQALENLRQALLRPNLPQAAELVAGIAFSNRSLPRKMEPTARDVLRQSRESARAAVKSLTAMLSYCDEESFRRDQQILYPSAACLFALTREFSESYAALKREKNLVDFSDAEQFMLSLLWQQRPDGTVERTALSEELSRRFDEIYIDEYQDVNAAQEMIFEAIAPRDGRIFMVGDDKQSIYGFRQADAEIFNRKKKTFLDFDGKHFPAKIFFDSNFRSRGGVTEFVNTVFRKIMTPRSGGSYTEREALKAQRVFPPHPGALTSLLFYECEAGTREKDWLEDEVRLTAQIIKKYVADGFPVTDREGLRPCRYGDFCILLRSDSGRFAAFREALREAGIPSETDGGDADFLESRELLLVLSLLKSIHNPYDDIALCAAMMSPVFLFTPSELALLRAGEDRRKPLLDAVKSASCAEPKVAAFLKTLRFLQSLAASQSVDDLLSTLYEHFGLYAYVGALPGGSARLENLDLFRVYARKFEQNGYRGLGAFLRFLTQGQENGKALRGASVLPESRNAVRLLTIHKSKGLEFPICILSNTVKGFNRKDLNENTLLSRDLGFACLAKDTGRAVSWAPMTYTALREQKREEQTAEEMRVLYVAMTRAQDQLIIPIVRANMKKFLDQAAVSVAGGEEAAARADSFAQWILQGVSGAPALEPVISAYNAVSAPPADSCRFSARPVVSIEADTAVQTEEPAPADAQLFAELCRRAAYRYPFEEQAKIDSKFSVSELVEGEQESAFDFERVPDFMMEQRMDGAQRGQAMHSFLQYADFAAAKRDCASEFARLCAAGFLTERQADVIERERLEKFLSSSLCARILSAKEVLREYKFTIGMDSTQFGGSAAAGDTVILQGVADCILMEQDGCVLVDYKTDTVKTPEELTARYQKQLELYKEAIERILEKPVKACILYSFCLGREISL